MADCPAMISTIAFFLSLGGFPPSPLKHAPAGHTQKKDLGFIFAPGSFLFFRLCFFTAPFLTVSPVIVLLLWYTFPF